MTTRREMFPKGRFVVVKMENRVSYAGGGHVGRRGEIVVLGAADELGWGDSCELRDGVMVKGWPSGPRAEAPTPTSTRCKAWCCMAATAGPRLKPGSRTSDATGWAGRVIKRDKLARISQEDQT